MRWIYIAVSLAAIFACMAQAQSAPAKPSNAPAKAPAAQGVAHLMLPPPPVVVVRTK